jgi:CheY-like chemotaxis protein
MAIDPQFSETQLREFAHEIRAPLGGLEAMVEMLRLTPLDAEQARVVAALAASAQHLRALAGTVLGAPATPDRESADDSPFETLITACRARALAKGLEFRVAAFDAEACRAMPHPRELRQVIENLVDNAIRLTATGHVELTLVPAGRDRIRISVADTGPGLLPEEADRLIREGGAIAGRAGGAGIGLTIAGRIVAAHGGSLTGGPAPGGGACFTFDWPCISGGQGPLVLIVDDHPASRAVLATILQAAGYVCIEASGASEALALIVERKPAAVLTDLHMPAGGGEELVRAVRRMAEPPALIIVSADSVEPGHPVAGMVDGIIRKPISVRRVLEAVAAVLPRRADAA